MCSPDFFGVEYAINPWMTHQIGEVNRLRAHQQWNAFYSAVKQCTEVKLIAPRPKVPDLVFTANSGLQLGERVILSHFCHPERNLEEPFFKEWFRSDGYETIDMDTSLHFEGAGDALFQPGSNLLWAGYGFRTDIEAHRFLSRALQVDVVSLHLIDPRFYHLDTCFCPLSDNRAMYYPQAFDDESLRLIETHIPENNRIAVSQRDALHFACNAVVIDNILFMNCASEELKDILAKLGYDVRIQPVTEFMKAGGANKCLTLNLQASS